MNETLIFTIIYMVGLVLCLLTLPSYFVYGMTYIEHLQGKDEVERAIKKELDDSFMITEIGHLQREHKNWVKVYVKTCIRSEPYKCTNEYVWYNFGTKEIKMGNLNNYSWY